jgi:hypothetical protein
MNRETLWRRQLLPAGLIVVALFWLLIAFGPQGIPIDMVLAGDGWEPPAGALPGRWCALWRDDVGWTRWQLDDDEATCEVDTSDARAVSVEVVVPKRPAPTATPRSASARGTRWSSGHSMRLLESRFRSRGPSRKAWRSGTRTKSSGIAVTNSRHAVGWLSPLSTVLDLALGTSCTGV